MPERRSEIERLAQVPRFPCSALSPPFHPRGCSSCPKRYLYGRQRLRHRQAQTATSRPQDPPAPSCDRARPLPLGSDTVRGHQRGPLFRWPRARSSKGRPVPMRSPSPTAQPRVKGDKKRERGGGEKPTSVDTESASASLLKHIAQVR
jgi:hypothetical protein